MDTRLSCANPAQCPDSGARTPVSEQHAKVCAAHGAVAVEVCRAARGAPRAEQAGEVGAVNHAASVKVARALRALDDHRVLRDLRADVRAEREQTPRRAVVERGVVRIEPEGL